MSAGHATLSASGSAKWLSCPAALALEALINEPDTGSEYAWTGTAAHEILRRCLSLKIEPVRYLDDLIRVNTIDNGDGTYESKLIPVTQEMIDNVEIAIDYICRLTAKNGFYEERVDYSHIAPNGFGTADVILEVYDKVAPSKRVNTLYVIDFKYGFDKVDAFENSQSMLYGLGGLNSLDLLFERKIERFVIVIIQPRIDNISEYEISVTDLLKWGEEIKPKAQKAYDLYELAAISESDDIYDPRNFNPTKKGCKWCQGRTLKRCKAHAHAGYSATIEGFDDLTIEQKSNLPAIPVSENTIKDPAFLDSADLAAIYLKMQLFLSFGESLADEIIKRITSGQVIPGLRLIPTEKPRAWKGDTEASIKAMRTAGLQKENYLKYDIISPTEAQKALKEVKPKDHKRRYKRLEAVAIHRPKGKDKIIEDKTKPAEDIDDLLS